MSKDINLNFLGEEYSKYPFEVENTVFFTRKSIEKDMKYITHQSAYIFTVQGKAKIQFDNEIFLAEKGKVIHGCPNKLVTFTPIDNENFSHINIYYTPLKFDGKKTNYMNSTFELSIGDNDNIPKYLQKLLLLSSKPNIQSHFRKKTLFYSILDEIFKCYNCKTNHSDKDFIDSCIYYISKNYMNHITLDSLARAFKKTPQQFSYLFYKYTGIRPINYVIQYRMEIALKLLTIDRLSVREIAEKVGYSDPFYFSKLFKKHIGNSPRNIKKLF